MARLIMGAYEITLDLHRRAAEFKRRGRPGLHDADLEIVIGEQTEKDLIELFNGMAGTSVAPIKTLHGGEVMGMTVRVDSSTAPRLWGVRVKRHRPGYFRSLRATD